MNDGPGVSPKGLQRGWSPFLFSQSSFEQRALHVASSRRASKLRSSFG